MSGGYGPRRPPVADGWAIGPAATVARLTDEERRIASIVRCTGLSAAEVEAQLWDLLLSGVMSEEAEEWAERYGDLPPTDKDERFALAAARDAPAAPPLLERVAITLCGRWSSRLLAARLGQKNDRSIRRWRAGTREVPLGAWRELDRLLAGSGKKGAYLRIEIAAEIARLEREGGAQ